MMYYRLVEATDGIGDVKDAGGKAYTLCETGAAYSANGVNIGYTPFPSREACLAAWGLREITEEERLAALESAAELANDVE